MRNTLSSATLLLLASSAFAQTVDSVKYYRKEAAKILKQYHDEAMNDPRMIEIRENLPRVIRNTDNYSTVVLYAQGRTVDYDKFNADNAQAGFGSISSPSISVGFGFSFKKNAMVYDINLAASGIPYKPKRNIGTLSTTFSSLFQFSIGYDLIRKRTFNLYPYAGIGLRVDEINFDAPVQLNPNPSGVTQVIANSTSFYSSHTDLGYQAGLAFEALLSKPDRMGANLVFLKVGTDRPFKENDFNIHGYKYNGGFNAGKLDIAVGFKFSGR